MRLSTGWAIETWATKPGPKKLFSRAKVRSMNWSAMTKVPGGSSSLSEPQAGDRDQIGDAGALQRIDIGAVVDRGRRLDMAAAVARQEDQVDALEGAEQQRVGGLAPRAI